MTSPCSPSVSAMTSPAADMVLVDAGQLLYHIVRPVAGTAEYLRRSTGNHHSVSTKIVLFDR